MTASQPFYVGYLPLPQRWKSTILLFIAIWLIGLGGFAVVLAVQQDDPQTGVWDTSTVRDVEGVLEVDPYPVLYLEQDGQPHKGMLLVSELKFGVTDRAAPYDGQRVRARGHFVGQESRGMLEIVQGEDVFQTLPSEAPTVARRELGKHTLQGEIVDSKCFLGVMKPGYGKTHRACAVRCLSGGITPVFVTRDAQGAATIYVLTDADNGPIHDLILDYVAEPVEFTGEVHARGDLLFFAVDRESLRRLP